MIPPFGESYCVSTRGWPLSLWFTPTSCPGRKPSKTGTLPMMLWKCVTQHLLDGTLLVTSRQRLPVTPLQLDSGPLVSAREASSSISRNHQFSESDQSGGANQHLQHVHTYLVECVECPSFSTFHVHSFNGPDKLGSYGCYIRPPMSEPLGAWDVCFHMSSCDCLSR